MNMRFNTDLLVDYLDTLLLDTALLSKKNLEVTESIEESCRLESVCFLNDKKSQPQTLSALLQLLMLAEKLPEGRLKLFTLRECQEILNGF